MDWANERYVRIYTRDTADILAIRWQGRTVLWEMTRKADRAGVIDTTDNDVLAEMLRLPIEVVEAGVDNLIERGSIEYGELDGKPVIVIPNYIPAQEAAQSDRQRQKESRATRRDRARDVTKRNTNVTNGHSRSPRTDPYLAKPTRTKKEERLDQTVESLWEYQESQRANAIPGSRPLRLTKSRRKRVLAAVREFGEEDCRAVVDEYARAARANKAQRQWFNGDTNWRIPNMSRALGIAASGGGANGSGNGAAYPYTRDFTAEVMADDKEDDGDYTPTEFPD